MHDPPTSGRSRHLTAVPPTPEPQPTGRIRLSLWHRQEAEDARQLLYRLAETDADGLAPGQLAFTLGRLHGAALNLLDIIDTITEP